MKNNKILINIKDKIKCLAKNIKNKFILFWQNFKKAHINTKVSYFIMGYANLAKKQIVKGLIYLISELFFLFVFIFSPKVKGTNLGFKAILNLFNLGTNEGTIFIEADNSLLMLLYGIVMVFYLILQIFIWKSSLNSARKLEKVKQANTFKQDVLEMFDSGFHKTFLTPAIIGILILTIIPNLFMILVAFTNFGPGHLPPNQLFDWIGFKNFLGLFDKNNELSGFWGVLGWTFLWAILATFSNYILGILLATLINSKFVKFKPMWRTIFVLTIAIPQFVSLLLIRQLLSEYGPVNEMLMRLGIINERMLFLGNAKNMWTARFMVVLINIWVGVPYTMLMTSGILLNVPKDLYEAAEVDGATQRQIFRKITLPYIFFITTPYLISSFMGNITSFNIIFLLTGGGPNASAGPTPGDTDLLVTWLFRLTVEQDNYSTGAVISILTFVLMAVGTLFSYRRSKAYKEEGEFQV